MRRYDRYSVEFYPLMWLVISVIMVLRPPIEQGAKYRLNNFRSVVILLATPQEYVAFTTLFVKRKCPAASYFCGSLWYSSEIFLMYHSNWCRMTWIWLHEGQAACPHPVTRMQYSSYCHSDLSDNNKAIFSVMLCNSLPIIHWRRPVFFCPLIRQVSAFKK